MTETIPERVSYSGFGSLTIAADVFGEHASRPILFAHGGGQTRHAWRMTGGRWFLMESQMPL